MKNTITTFHYKHVYYRLLSISNIIIVHYKHDMCKVDLKHETDIINTLLRRFCQSVLHHYYMTLPDILLITTKQSIVRIHFLLFSATTTNDMASSIKHTGKHDSL